MGEPLAVIALLAPAMVLASTGAAHLGHLRTFKAQLRAQRLWPRFAEWPVAILVASSEAALGGLALVLAWRLPSGADGLRNVMYAVSGLFALFAALIAVLLTIRPGAPCGCHGTQEPASAWSLGRAVSLAAAAAYGASRVGDAGAINTLGWQDVVLVAAAGAFGLIIWTYPSALRDIDTRPARPAVRAA